MVTLRPAVADDDSALREIDRETWTTAVSPSPPPADEAPFFRPGVTPAEVTVAELDGRVVGYVSVHQPMPMPSHQHVLEVSGLAVSPTYAGRGVGRALVEAAKTYAARHGARKLTLRVLAPNTRARRLYESCGFVVEGELAEEFLLDGSYVDDVLMACPLT